MPIVFVLAVLCGLAPARAARSAGEPVRYLVEGRCVDTDGVPFVAHRIRLQGQRTTLEWRRTDDHGGFRFDVYGPPGARLELFPPEGLEGKLGEARLPDSRPLVVEKMITLVALRTDYAPIRFCVNGLPAGADPAGIDLRVDNQTAEFASIGNGIFATLREWPSRPYELALIDPSGASDVRRIHHLREVGRAPVVPFRLDLGLVAQLDLEVPEPYALTDFEARWVGGGKSHWIRPGYPSWVVLDDRESVLQQADETALVVASQDGVWSATVRVSVDDFAHGAIPRLRPWLAVVGTALTGRVVDEATGEPVARQLLFEWSGSQPVGVTDDDGRFSITLREPERVRLRVTSFYCETADIDWLPVLGRNVLPEVRLRRPARRATLRGWIRCSGAEDLSMASLDRPGAFAQIGLPPYGKRHYFDRLSFAVPDVPYGEYVVSLSAPLCGDGPRLHVRVTVPGPDVLLICHEFPDTAR